MADANPIPAPQPIDPELAAPLQNGTSTSADVEMADSHPTPHEPVPPVATTSTAPTPAAPTPTTTRNSPHPSAPSQAPTQPIPHGSPTRLYLNQHVTPHLLEAMKHLVTNEPEKPLKFLSDFLAQKSAELEG
ncbi:hypothetical protein CC80DRAFT_490249 [Byssothecium circinans]|uniref:Uncharacterized protein n=1 Tax=Byssothecium circinans TaxID=147558 RepID=A0A6A5U3R4_9PLEO|nr:hypothetical protein CC80DRAFT_490249 [Byssothecium circinans]